VLPVGYTTNVSEKMFKMSKQAETSFTQGDTKPAKAH